MALRRKSDEGVSEVVGSVILVAISVVALSGFGLVVLSTVSSDATVVPTASFEISPRSGDATLDVRFVSGMPFGIGEATLVLHVNGTDRIAGSYVDSKAADGRFHPGDTLRVNLTSPPLGEGANILLLVIHKETGKQIGVGRASVLSPATVPPYTTPENRSVVASAIVTPDVLVADGAQLATLRVRVDSPFGRVLVASVEADLSAFGGASTLLLSDSGADGDETAADGVFTGTFTVAHYPFASNPAFVSVGIPVLVRHALGHEDAGTASLILSSPPISKVVSGAIFRPLPASAAVGYLNLTNFTIRNGALLDNDQLEIHVSDLDDSTLAWTALISFNDTGCVTWVNLTRDGVAGGSSLRPASGCFQIGPDAQLNLADPSASRDESGATAAWVLEGGPLSTFGYAAALLTANNEAIVTFLGDTTSVGLSQLGLGQSDLVWDSLGSASLTAPTAPPTLAATAGNAAVSLAWGAPASDGGSPITGYRIHRGTSSGSAVLIDTIAANTSYVAAGLVNGQPYYFQIAAMNAIGEGARSVERTATPVSGPSAPTSFAATPGDGAVSLTWAPPADDGGSPITGYNIHRSTASGTSTLIDTIGTNTSYVADDLQNGQAYHFRVSAVTALAEGALTPEVAATPSTVPAAPGALAASAGDASIQLAWVTPDDGGSSLTGFKVYQTSPGGTVLLATTSDGANTTFTVNSLANGQPYSFVVTALNAHGEGAVSSTASGTPAAGSTAPTPPQSLAATRGNASVGLTWSPPASTGGSPVTTYHIHMGPSSGAESFLASTQSGANTTFTVNGLTNGVTYFFNISAVNAVGESASSNHASATPAAVPYPPTALAGVRGNGSVALSWSAPSDDGSSAITDYQVHVNGTHIASTGGSNASFVVGELLNGVAYAFSVTAVNGVGESSPSATATITPATTPEPPAGLAASPSSGAVALSWTPGATGGSPLTAYKIHQTAPGATTMVATTSGANTSFTVNGLTNGQAYTFVVVAVNAIGESAPSNAASATPATVPGAPTSLLATKNNGSVSLSWTAPPSGGSTITSYKIHRGTAAGTLTLLDTIGTNTSYVSAGLTNGQTYHYAIVAGNAVGDSLASNEASATPSTVPNPPAGLAATATSSSSVTLTWTTPSNGGSSLTTYKIYRGATSGSETFLATTGSGANTSFTVNGLAASTTHWFNVTAVNANGESSSSNHASAATPAPGTTTQMDCARVTTTAGALNSCSSITVADGAYADFQEGTGNPKLFSATFNQSVSGLTGTTHTLQVNGYQQTSAEVLHFQVWNGTMNGWRTVLSMPTSATTATTFTGTIHAAGEFVGGFMQIRVIDDNTLNGGGDSPLTHWYIDYIRMVST